MPGVSARRRGLPPLPMKRTLRCPRSTPRSPTSRPTTSPTRRPRSASRAITARFRTAVGPVAAAAAASSASTSSGRQPAVAEWSRDPRAVRATDRIRRHRASLTRKSYQLDRPDSLRATVARRTAGLQPAGVRVDVEERRPQRVHVTRRAPGQPGGDVAPVRVTGVRGQPPVGQPRSVNSIAAWPVTRAAVGRGARSVTAVRLPARAAPGTQARRGPLYNDVLNVVDPWI